MNTIESLLRDGRVDKDATKEIYFIYEDKSPEIIQALKGGMLLADGQMYVLVYLDGTKEMVVGNSADTYDSAFKVSESSDEPTTVTWASVSNKPTEFPPANHTHTINEVNGLQEELDSKVDVSDIPDVSDFVTEQQLNDGLNTKSDINHTHSINEVEGLGDELNNKVEFIEGKIPEQYLPSYVDNVQEGTLATFPDPGMSNIVYLDTDTNIPYRWGGSSYVEITSGGIALGETSATAYRGDRGKIAYDHTSDLENPHEVTASQIGLGNVNNTSDANKPVSIATQTALDNKVNFPATNGHIPVRTSTGLQGSQPFTSATTGNTIMFRDSNGRSHVAAPTENTHIANKAYADRVWMPDYSNMETTNMITTHGGTWTVPSGRRGWVKLYTRTYTGGVLDAEVFLINGKVMENIWHEATSGSGTARSGSRSGLFQVKGGDTVQVYGNLERSCYFIPGVWV